MKEIKEFIQELCDCAKPSANGSVVALEDATRIVAEAFRSTRNGVGAEYLFRLSCIVNHCFMARWRNW